MWCSFQSCINWKNYHTEFSIAWFHYTNTKSRSNHNHNLNTPNNPSNMIHLPAPTFWPTIWVDVLSNLPQVFLLVGILFQFDFETTWKMCQWQNQGQSWHTRDGDDDFSAYMRVVWQTPTSLSAILFYAWTIQFLLTFFMVYFHFRTKHHPIFYVNQASQLSSYVYIVRGTAVSFGSYFGTEE